MIVAGLDIESTSKLHPEHRIIELCLKKYQFDPSPRGLYTPIGEKTWRIHPDRSIDPKAYAVHRISLDDLAGCPKFEAVAHDIVGFMDDVELFVAHNGDEFDRPFIRMELERTAPALVPKLDNQRWFDTMQEGRWAHPWGKVPNLRELCWASDVHYDPAKSHAADYDVTVMMHSFFFGVQSGFFKIDHKAATIAA